MRSAVIVVVVVGLVVACGSGSGTPGGNGGSGGQGGAGGQGGGGGHGGGDQDTGTCEPLDGKCSTASDCCTQPHGVACVAVSPDESVCFGKCTEASECSSGCCAPAKDESYSICTAGAQPGAACTTPTECCQGGAGIPNGAACVSVDGKADACGSICTKSSECAAPGCCNQVKAETYGVCVTSSAGVTCLP
jgi:hypothetical protein